MLLDTMTAQEIRTVVTRELPDILNRTKYIPQENRRLIAKNKDYPISVLVSWTNPKTKTPWTLSMICLEDPRNYEPEWNFYATYESPHGRGIFALPYDPFSDQFKIFKYTAHFFKRYRERYINVIAPEESDRVPTAELQEMTIMHYITENIYTFREITIDPKTMRFEGSTPNGTIFGIAEPDPKGELDFYTVKTFVNNDMLFESQREASDKRIEKMYSIFKYAANAARTEKGIHHFIPPGNLNLKTPR